MGQFGIGQSVTRSEDARFLRGTGRYTDDISLPGQARAFVVRSPFAHARFRITDVAQAKAAPGVLGVFTGADAAADGLGDIPCNAPVKNRDGTDSVSPPYPVLCIDTARHVGDAVALVVAETIAQARDAAELIEIEWDDQPAVADIGAALAPGAPLVWPQAKGNLVFDWSLGDEAATDAAFRTAARVVRLDLVNNRVVVNSMETRGAIGAYDPAADSYTLYTSSQGSHDVRKMLCEAVLKVDKSKVRVVTPDVGGGFGMKLFLYREHALVVWAARKVGRPVKWTADRTEAFVSDTQGRDHLSHAELALDADGRFLALKVATDADLGAYLSNYGPFIPTAAGSGMLAGLYATPHIFVRVRGAFTHTVPIDAYRGAGRPEAAYLVERLVDKAAREIGLAPDEIRRRNFIPASAMPYRTALGEVYDSGDFAGHMDKAMRLADWAGAAARKTEAAARGRLRGVGMSTYVEACGGGGPEAATITVDPGGTVEITIGTQSTGQGHETAYAQVASDGLGVAFERISVFQGDTARIRSGAGTGGSRSLPVGGPAVGNAAKAVVEKGRKIAAHVLEAAEADIGYEDGRYKIVGTDRSMTLFEAAAAASDPAKLPPGMQPGLSERGRHSPPASTYPNGTHICELEVDAETGEVQVVGYTVVDDFGTVVNPLLLQGQVHGGVAQGVGQALYEGCRYDETGQPLTGSLMDYCLPRADNLPMVRFDLHPVPCTTNPMGIKGCGEAGAIGAPPAVINALVDALAPHGIEHIDMPATPDKVWAAIQASGRAKAAE